MHTKLFIFYYYLYVRFTDGTGAPPTSRQYTASPATYTLAAIQKMRLQSRAGFAESLSSRPDSNVPATPGIAANEFEIEYAQSACAGATSSTLELYDE